MSKATWEQTFSWLKVLIDEVWEQTVYTNTSSTSVNTLVYSKSVSHNKIYVEFKTKWAYSWYVRFCTWPYENWSYDNKIWSHYTEWEVITSEFTKTSSQQVWFWVNSNNTMSTNRSWFSYAKIFIVDPVLDKDWKKLIPKEVSEIGETITWILFGRLPNWDWRDGN